MTVALSVKYEKYIISASFTCSVQGNAAENETHPQTILPSFEFSQVLRKK